MKKVSVLFLLIIVLFSQAALAEEPQVLYTARLLKDAPLKPEPDKTLDNITIISTKTAIDIIELAPDWLYIRTAKGDRGYIQRRYVDFNKVEVVNPSTTPPYPAVLSEYVTWVENKTSVRDAANAQGKALITLQPGARLAIIGLEDGWAKMIYHRQYAYVDSRDLGELMPIANSTQQADGSSPIAAYTSFYKITDDENNRNRMVNIAVANDRMRPHIIKPGEDFDFNRDVGPYAKRAGYLPAITLVDGGTALGYGGGTCQVSSTLYNTLMQLPGLSVEARRPHGPGGASYLPLHADAAVGNSAINLVFRNLYSFPVRIDGSAQDGALTILIWPAEDKES